jgi:alpha-L-rhamnosidase
MQNVTIGVVFFLLPLTALAQGQTTDLTVERLLCEYRVKPLGIEAPHPRLSWVLRSAERGQKQTAYQILVASSPELLAKDQGDLWDSGKVVSDQSVHVAYSGKPLESRMRCHWKALAWDKNGQASAWSQPAQWTMGLLKPVDWQAQWITAGFPLPLLRREFDVSKPVRRAEVYLCGLGFNELHLNGRKVGDFVLEPGWTNYRKTCLYSTYDVTRQIAQGRNALGVMLGNSMYNVVGGRYVKFLDSFGPPKLILQLHIEYADGTSLMIGSDDLWKAAAGPTTFSCIYGGEDYDARREIAGWTEPAFDDLAWMAVKVVAGPGGRLIAQSAPPIKVMKEYRPIKVTEPLPGVFAYGPGVFVYDLGRNVSGWPQLIVEGPAGATVKMIPGELLDAAGLVTQAHSGTPVWFSYTLKGRGREVWHPRFSYYGFRYVQVEVVVPPGTADAPAKRPSFVDLTGQFVHCSAETVGGLSCSNPKVNQVHDLINASILSNLQSVLTDCPHREKLGWLEVSHLLAGSMMFNYRLPTFYAKICRDMRDAQLADGLVPNIAPEYVAFRGSFRDSPEWGSACVINPWHVDQMYGDPSLLDEQYDSMKKYVDYLGSKSKEHIVSYGLGDWYDIGPREPGESQLTSRGFTSTAIYYRDIVILQRAAQLLGKRDDAKKYADLARDVRAAFNRAFFHPGNNQYDRNSQTANAMPLVLGLVEEDKRTAVLENLVDAIRANGNRVTAGDVGFAFVVRALTDGGRGDVLYDMVCQEKGPGYMLQLKKGATTLTEAWDANPTHSQNHCMLGHAEEWFYRGLGGIIPDESAPGFKRFFIKPQIVPDLTWVKASYDSMFGRIASNWKRDGETLMLSVSVPPNTTATVHVPASDAAGIREGKEPAANASGARFLRMEPGAAVFEVGSGDYYFSTRIIATH